MILNDTQIREAIRRGHIVLQDGNPHNDDLVRPNSLDTTVGPTVLVEVPGNWAKLAPQAMHTPETPDWLRAAYDAGDLDFHTDKHGNTYFKIRLDTAVRYRLEIQPGQRVIVTSNERLKGILTEITAQAVLRSGAAHAGWALSGGFAESGFGSDPEGHMREQDFKPGSESTWVDGPEWGGVVFSFALTNLSLNPRPLRYQDRLVQLVFSEAYQPEHPYHIRESSSYRTQQRVEDRVR